MLKKNLSAGFVILLASILLLTGCSSPTSAPEATNDANAVYTQAAETVQAGLAQTQAAKPPATATEQVTPTFDPTVAAALTAVANFTASAQESGQQPTATQDAASQNTTPQASITPAVQLTPITQATSSSGGAVASSGDKAELISQSPTDGTSIPKNSTWDMTLVVKNAGTTTWDSKYALKFFAGDRMESPNDLYIVGEVKPGATYTFLFSMKAPDSKGTKQTNWVIQNGNGANFYAMFVKIEVTD